MLVRGHVLEQRLDGYSYDSGKKIRLHCPFCDPHQELNRNAYVVVRTGRFHCFKCEENSTVKQILEDLLGYEDGSWAVEESPTRTIEALKEQLANLHKSEQELGTNSQHLEIKGYKLLADGGTRLSRRMLNYLRTRGWDEHECEKRRVGYTTHLDILSGRVVFPVFEDWAEGGMVYYQARTLSDEVEPKYVNPVVNKSKIVYVRPDADFSKRIVLVEGIFDTNPQPNFCGLLGKRITPNQARVIRSFCKNVVLYLDPDVAPTIVSQNAMLLIESGCSVSVAECSGDDPGSTPISVVRNDLKNLHNLTYSGLLSYRITHH